MLEVEVIANNSTVLSPMWLSKTVTEFTKRVDLVQGTPSTPFSYSGSGSQKYWGQVSGNLETMWSGGKVPTWLWLPTDNSTVNGLPVGLEHYTGEQSFDLVVVNTSSSVTSRPIPLPWGGYAASAITLSPGRNDFLIPRG